MKKLSTLLFFVFSCIWVNAQSDLEQINATLMKYIEGTANGEPEKLEEAFFADFHLFLVDGDSLRIIDGKGYISRVEKGKKYNRIAKIVAVDYENDAASAKIEVYFPDRKVIATDYLLLLKTKDQWKIIHKIINLKQYQIIEDLITEEKYGIDGIQLAIADYIEGTANGAPQRLSNIFYPEFNLYYIKEGQITVLDGKKYLNNFKEGEQYNRIGHLLALDYENNAGIAKVQVLMPPRKRIAIDYLLLLKVGGVWKIIHKSFTSKKYTATHSQ